MLKYFRNGHIFAHVNRCETQLLNSTGTDFCQRYLCYQAHKTSTELLTIALSITDITSETLNGKFTAFKVILNVLLNCTLKTTVTA